MGNYSKILAKVKDTESKYRSMIENFKPVETKIEWIGVDKENTVLRFVVKLSNPNNYTLKGVDGYFNSVWFDDVKIGLVIATKAPKIGERFLCYEYAPNANKYFRVTVLTSRVRKVEQLTNKGYKIYTLNSCYIVHLI